MPSPAGFRAWLPLVGLIVVIGATAAAVDSAAPDGALRAAERPYADPGDPRVRTGDARFPRTATSSDGVPVILAAPPRRLASQYWSIDEFAYAVVPPERVVAVSDAAYLRSISNVYAQVQRFRPTAVTGSGQIDAERLLRAEPDLALVSSTARGDMSHVLRLAGVPTYRMFTLFTTLAQVEDHIRLVGYLTGEDGRALLEATRFREAVARAAGRRPAGARPRVLGLGGRHTYGSQTLFHDICRVLGAVNVSGDSLTGYNAVNAEQIVRWDPEWIVTGAEPGKVEDVRRRVSNDPAIRVTQAAARGRIVVLEHHVFLPLSPYSTRLVEALAEALYGHARS
jgi:iron complex transport system substrate-binding protein